MELNADTLLWQEFVPGGGHWSWRIKRGDTLRITDLQGGANVAAMFYHAQLLLERYNMADTLKAQHTAHLTRGNVLLSDMGRVLCSITGDSVGWHDPLCSITDAAWVQARYGRADYQEHRNAMYRNAQDGLLIELGKWGLGKRDLQTAVNFFSKVQGDEEGRLQFVAGHSPAGATLDLRFEMDTVVALAACQHALDGNPDYAPKPVQLSLYRTGPAPKDDYCRSFRPENGRALILTERFYA